MLICSITTRIKKLIETLDRLNALDVMPKSPKALNISGKIDTIPNFIISPMISYSSLAADKALIISVDRLLKPFGEFGVNITLDLPFLVIFSRVSRY